MLSLTFKIIHKFYLHKQLRSFQRLAAKCGMPRLIRLCDGNLSDHVNLATECLKIGKLVALPTDTLYGLAGLAQHKEAVSEIYRVKQRNQAKPLAVCVGHVDDIYQWAEVTVVQELLEDLLPGPVTLLFRRSAALNIDLNPGTDLIGIRIPDSEFICEVTKKCCAPLALTSANISSQPSPLTVQEFESIWSDITCVFDGGKITSSAFTKYSEVLLQKKNKKIVSSDSDNCLEPKFIFDCTNFSSQSTDWSVREGSTIVNLAEPGYYSVHRKGIALSSTLKILHKYGLKPVE